MATPSPRTRTRSLAALAVFSIAHSSGGEELFYLLKRFGLDPALPEPWRLADRYALGPTLGEGGMGEVHECHDVLLDRTVALKSVRRDLHARELDARFVLEARVQAQLEHPCVVPVYEMGRDDRGTAFFTMRKVQGITLEEVIRRTRAGDAAIAGSFTRHRLLTAFAQICLTLDSAHASGVPPNVVP